MQLRWEAEAGIERFVRDTGPAGEAADDEPVILVVGRLSDERGGGHAVFCCLDKGICRREDEDRGSGICG